MEVIIAKDSRRPSIESPLEGRVPFTDSGNPSSQIVRKSGGKTALENETDYLSREYITSRCQEEGIAINCSLASDFEPPPELRKVLELLRRFTKKYEAKYSERMNSYCQQLKNNKSNAYRNFFDVAKELFRNNVKWEHVVVLFAFSAKLAMDYSAHNMTDYIESLVGWLSLYVHERLGDWIQAHDGWTGILKQPAPEQDNWPVVLHIGVACALGYGLYKWLTT